MPSDCLPGLSFGELMEGQFPPRAPMVGSWLLERSLNMIHAPAGVGKSMLCLGLSIGLASGCDFLSWRIPQARRVLYLDAEMDPSDLQERASCLMKASGMSKEQKRALWDNLWIVSQQSPEEVAPVPDLKEETDETKEMLGNALEAFSADLVVVDNLSTFADVEDENSAGGFSFVVEIGNYLKSKGCAVLFVHHDRKGQGGSESFRGSGKLEAPLDTRWGIRRPTCGASAGGLGFTLEPFKMRPRVGDDVRTFSASLEDDGSNPGWNINDSSQADDVVHDYVSRVRTCVFAKAGEVAAALGVSQSKVSRLKRQAMQEGLISEEEIRECFRKAKESDF